MVKGGSEYTFATLAVAGVAFIAGFVLEMVLCRLFGSRGRDRGPSRRQAAERRHPAD